MAVDLAALYFLVEIRLRRERHFKRDAWNATVYKLGHPVCNCIAHWASDAVNGAIEELRLWAHKKEKEIGENQNDALDTGSGSVPLPTPDEKGGHQPVDTVSRPGEQNCQGNTATNGPALGSGNGSGPCVEIPANVQESNDLPGSGSGHGGRKRGNRKPKSPDSKPRRKKA